MGTRSRSLSAISGQQRHHCKEAFLSAIQSKYHLRQRGWGALEGFGTLSGVDSLSLSLSLALCVCLCISIHPSIHPSKKKNVTVARTTGSKAKTSVAHNIGIRASKFSITLSHHSRGFFFLDCCQQATPPSPLIVATLLLQ